VAHQSLDRMVDWRLKRYGRILGRDIEQQLIAFREFERQGAELKSLISGDDALKFWTKLAQNPAWAHYYLEPFATLVARFAILSGTGGVISRIAQDEFPADRLEAELTPALEHAEPSDDSALIPLMFALLANLESIARYSCTMSDLIRRFRERACVHSLARAASIDVGVLALPATQILLKSLQLAGDSASLADFLRGIAQGPHQARAPYQELRWIEYLLREQQALGVASNEDIYQLVVHGLRIYGDDSEHKDSKKALFALFRKWQREQAN
jgi:hypothetical protein